MAGTEEIETPPASEPHEGRVWAVLFIAVAIKAVLAGWLAWIFAGATAVSAWAGQMAQVPPAPPSALREIGRIAVAFVTVAAVSGLFGLAVAALQRLFLRVVPAQWLMDTATIAAWIGGIGVLVVKVLFGIAPSLRHMPGPVLSFAAIVVAEGIAMLLVQRRMLAERSAVATE